MRCSSTRGWCWAATTTSSRSTSASIRRWSTSSSVPGSSWGSACWYDGHGDVVGRGRLAGGAPPDDAFLGGGAQPGPSDGGAAAAAGAAVAAEDVGGLPGAADAGGDADGGVAVGPHDAAGHVEDVVDVDVGYPTGGV